MAVDLLCFLTQAVASLALLGLAWFVQLVHYPLFGLVGPEHFARYEEDHVRRVTWIAAPLMLLEAGSALGLLLRRPDCVPAGAAWAGAALVGVVWGSTFLLQVPAHTRLSTGFDPRTAAWLVSSSWVRTGAWTARAALITACLAWGLD